MFLSQLNVRKNIRNNNAKSFSRNLTLILSIAKALSLVSILVGAWGLFSYCKINNIPFPLSLSQLPALLISVGTIGFWAAFVLSGFAFFPLLGREGVLGEEYYFLIGKTSSETVRIKILGFVLIPVFLFQFNFIFSAWAEYKLWDGTPLKNLATSIHMLVYFCFSLCSIAITAWFKFDKKDVLAAILYAVLFSSLVVGWSLLALMFLMQGLSILGFSDAKYGWFIVIALSFLIMIFIYFGMRPKTLSGVSEAGIGLILSTMLFVVLIFNPESISKISGYALGQFKVGGGYQAKYIIRDKSDSKALTDLMAEKNETKVLSVILDAGDRVYVSDVSNKTSTVYMIPFSLISGQKITKSK